MTCLLCYFDEDNQAIERTRAQSATESHEEALKNYSSFLRDEFSRLGSVQACSIHQMLHARVQAWVEDYRSALLQQRSGALDRYLAELPATYDAWIREQPRAPQLLDGLMRDAGAFGAGTDTLGHRVFFRGRVSDKHPGQPLQRDELLHIPFNMRYLVGNQRFSASGLPMLYLGASVVDVIHELRAEQSPTDQITLTAFAFRELHSLKLATFHSGFGELFHDGLAPMIESDISVRYGAGGWPGDAECVPLFKRFLLACFFSFSRRKEGAAFCEEYVLPQLATCLARDAGCDGVRHASTRIPSHWTSTSTPPWRRYTQNIALFTRYQGLKKRYDAALLDKFEISDPELLSTLSASPAPQSPTTFPHQARWIKEHLPFEQLVTTDSNAGTYFAHPWGRAHEVLLDRVLLQLRL